MCVFTEKVCEKKFTRTLLHSHQSTTRKCGLPGTHTNEYKIHIKKNKINAITVSVDKCFSKARPEICNKLMNVCLTNSHTLKYFAKFELYNF